MIKCVSMFPEELCVTALLCRKNVDLQRPRVSAQSDAHASPTPVFPCELYLNATRCCLCLVEGYSSHHLTFSSPSFYLKRWHHHHRHQPPGVIWRFCLCARYLMFATWQERRKRLSHCLAGGRSPGEIVKNTLSQRTKETSNIHSVPRFPRLSLLSHFLHPYVRTLEGLLAVKSMSSKLCHKKMTSHVPLGDYESLMGGRCTLICGVFKSAIQQPPGNKTHFIHSICKMGHLCFFLLLKMSYSIHISAHSGIDVWRQSYKDPGNEPWEQKRASV